DQPAAEHAHRLAAAAGTSPERAEVVHAGEEDGAEHHPGEGRSPAPDHRDRRADDGRCAGYRSEMVAPEDELVGWHVIHTVAHGVRRRTEAGIETVDPFGDELGVENVAQRHGGQADEQQCDCTHLGFLGVPRADGNTALSPSWGNCYDLAPMPRPQGAQTSVWR